MSIWLWLDAGCERSPSRFEKTRNLIAIDVSSMSGTVTAKQNSPCGFDS